MVGEYVERPWGSYESLLLAENYQVKRITVHPHAQLSLQSHHHRSEHWIIVSGEGIVTKGTQEIIVHPNDVVYIAKEEKHRMSNPGEQEVIFIEVQCGDYLGEDDIIRYEDLYGRH